jgi:O-antigen ligase
MPADLARLGPVLDRRFAGAVVGALGAGTVMALAGGGARAPVLIAVGCGAAGVALVLLMAHEWLDAMLVVALSAPLPALYAADGVRIAAAAPVTAAAIAAWMLRGGPLARGFDPGALPWRTLAFLALVLCAAAAVAVQPVLALRELVNLLLLLALVVAATDWLRARPGARPRVAGALAMLAVGCGALAVLEAVGVIPGAFPRFDTPYNRAALGFGQPNGLGLFLAVTLPLVVWRAGSAEGGGRQLLWRTGVAVVAAGLLATFSRGSWASAIAGAALLALAGQWRTTLKIFGVALIAVALLDVGSGGMVRDTIARTFGDWVVEQRAALTLSGILMFLDHPFMGVGPGGFETHVDQYGILVPELFDFQPTPHNAYVQMAAEAGLAGLVLYVVLLGVLVRESARALRERRGGEAEFALQRALLWSLGALVMSGFFVWPYAHGTGQAVMLVCALVASAPRAAVGAAIR